MGFSYYSGSLRIRCREQGGGGVKVERRLDTDRENGDSRWQVFEGPHDTIDEPLFRVCALGNVHSAC